MLRTSTSPDRRYPTLFGRRLRDLAPDFAALSALLGFVVATVALLAYRLPLPDVVQSRPGDPAHLPPRGFPRPALTRAPLTGRARSSVQARLAR